MLRAVEVKTWKQVRQFLHLPHLIHANTSSRWIAPLKLYERIAMGRLSEPGKGFWLVMDGQQPVARMGARRHTHAGHERLHFGFFECFERTPEAVPLLFEKAQALAPELELHGPYHFTMEDPYTGILVEGFEHDPVFLASYNPPYYEDYLLKAGLEPMMDLYSYQFLPEEIRLDRMERRAKKAAKNGVSVRMMDNSRRADEMRTCIEIADQAWVDNWGFEEFDEEQIQTLIMFCKVFFDRRGIVFAQHEGRDVGFVWVLRDYNKFLKPAQGRLTLKLLWSLFFRRDTLESFRGYALGVLPDYQHLSVSGALVHDIMQKGHEFPWSEFDVSWVLADNFRMNAMARALGGHQYKTHRLYKRAPVTSA